MLYDLKILAMNSWPVITEQRHWPGAIVSHASAYVTRWGSCDTTIYSDDCRSSWDMAENYGESL